MEEISLARLQYLIKSTNDEIKYLSARLQNWTVDYKFKVFSLTTQEKYEKFLQSLTRHKDEFMENLDKLNSLHDYITYLRNILNDANIKYGISQKLVEADTVNRMFEFLSYYIKNRLDSENKQSTPVENVDYFKSSFTDQNKIYELVECMFNDNDIKSFSAQMDALLEKKRKIYDEIAALNQINKVEIKTFTEFQA